MAEQMDPKKYENMITALNSYAAKTGLATEKLYAISASCKQTLGQNDLVATQMDPYIKEIATHYESAAAEARSIAASMQRELDEYYHKIKAAMAAQDDE